MSDTKTNYIGGLLMAVGVVVYIAVLAYIVFDNGPRGGRIQVSPLPTSRP